MARRWGWIPNLSGVAFDYESIRERLDSDAVRGSTWIHIQASPGPGDTVLINVVRILSMMIRNRADVARKGMSYGTTYSISWIPEGYAT